MTLAACAASHPARASDFGRVVLEMFLFFGGVMFFVAAACFAVAALARGTSRSTVGALSAVFVACTLIGLWVAVLVLREWNRVDASHAFVYGAAFTSAIATFAWMRVRHSGSPPTPRDPP